MRALRFAFTALPSPGITNCPLLLASFAATVASSARTTAADGEAGRARGFLAGPTMTGLEELLQP